MFLTKFGILSKSFPSAQPSNTSKDIKIATPIMNTYRFSPNST
jgi:hypothetical protein